MKVLKHLIFISLFFLPLLIIAQVKPVDLEIIHKIKQEGLKNSQIMEISFWMTDFVGPRLSGSKGLKRGYDWTKQKMEEIGLENVKIDPWGEFGKGWDNEKTYIAMTSPYYASLIGTPKAWTPGTDGYFKSEVILVNIQDTTDFEKFKGKLGGKIVTSPPATEYEVSFEPSASRLSDENLEERSKVRIASPYRRRIGDFAQYRAQRQLMNQISKFFLDEEAAVIISCRGSFGTIRSSGASYNVDADPVLPEIILTTEHHGRIVRLLQHDIQVEVEMEISNTFHDEDLLGYNVTGEIPGTDKSLKDEVVMIGAHLDSWHGGTGANDNGSGCIVMIEAMRILKAIGVKPKRTIKIGLWGAEEQGLHGSRGYVKKYLGDIATMELKPRHAKFSAYYNVDNGSGKIRGIYLQENDMLRPIFEAWFDPFKDMGVTTVSIRNTSGTDHLSFNAIGLPGFQFIQDPIDYGRGYHTNMDTYERLMMNDMMHNAVIVAAIVYHTAMRDELLPRKPLPEVQTRPER
jgi:carboxypeptidase Q